MSAILQTTFSNECVNIGSNSWLAERDTLFPKPWWRHQMETFSALLAFCAGNSPVTLVNSPHKGQWREALIFSLICVWNNSWVNNGDAGDLRHNRVHFDVIVTPVVNKSIDVFTRVTGTQWVKNLMQLQIYFGRDSDLGLILDKSQCIRMLLLNPHVAKILTRLQCHFEWCRLVLRILFVATNVQLEVRHNNVRLGHG